MHLGKPWQRRTNICPLKKSRADVKEAPSDETVCMNTRYRTILPLRLRCYLLSPLPLRHAAYNPGQPGCRQGLLCCSRLSYDPNCSSGGPKPGDARPACPAAQGSPPPPGGSFSGTDCGRRGISPPPPPPPPHGAPPPPADCRRGFGPPPPTEPGRPPPQPRGSPPFEAWRRAPAPAGFAKLLTAPSCRTPAVPDPPVSPSLSSPAESAEQL